MKMTVATIALSLLSFPALAQEMVTCGDYSIMDNAQQMETIAAIEEQTSEMAGDQSLTPEAIHEKLAGDCKDQVDMMVIEIVKGYKS